MVRVGIEGGNETDDDEEGMEDVFVRETCFRGLSRPAREYVALIPAWCGPLIV